MGWGEVEAKIDDEQGGGGGKRRRVSGVKTKMRADNDS